MSEFLGDEHSNISVSELESKCLFPSFDEVEEILGYQFKNKCLLEEALTHASLPKRCFSYQRLEFIGDSVLNLIFTKEQFFKYPDLPPGALTKLRSANVDTEKLARVAIKLGLHRFLRHEIPLLEQQYLIRPPRYAFPTEYWDARKSFFETWREYKTREFSQAILDYPLHSNGLVDAPKALADIVESIIGAVFIDSNFSIDTVWKVFKDLLEPIISQETLTVHPIAELYEVCQKRNLSVKFVDLWEENMAFDVFIDGQLVGTGIYGPKKEIAQNRAAKDALNNLVRILGEENGTFSSSTN